MSEAMEITEAEAQLYDRQIRLWGLESQKRLRSARILIIGMGGLGAEVSKNLVLAGVKSLTMMDSVGVGSSDASAQFLAPRDKMGNNRAEASKDRLQELNPMVKVSSESSSSEDKDGEYFRSFDIVCASCLPPSEYIRINEACREMKVKFYCGDVTGFFGYCFADLLRHEFVVESKSKGGVETVELEKKREDVKSDKKEGEEETTFMEKHVLEFVSLQEALKTNLKAPGIKIKRMDPAFFVLRMIHDFYTNHGSLPLPEKRVEHLPLLHKIKDKITRDYDLPSDKIPEEIIPLLFGELGPVSAIVGGVLAQEIIKGISNKDLPIENFFLYNPLNSRGLVECFKG
uniref:SUMO-activating enzyme subunit 1 n=1 Tax=Caligus rogercresseyi TaxID=217165 RepID=C1BMR4_CALRO|nr:SUMO-activating enzyme subunit 1 [Caligus rogercresseyi]|eukprot:TRINITY_DN3552_c0_g1_i1.p1 TRINITY_DN3552_c0_g1~~TRINITY_DN3552_c0_g1_i1.p1  ORF type:complete len:344 (-),score=115.93 TRINITY_DN3552_c0_g1_i1:108-1139(-)